MYTKNPTIEWHECYHDTCLLLTFKGNLERQNAENAIQIIEEILKKSPGKKLNMIWDTLEMGTYDSLGRVAWQKMLKTHKQSFGKIHVVTNSLLIKGGVRVMSTFSSLELKCVSSLNEIEFKKAQIA